MCVVARSMCHWCTCTYDCAIAQRHRCTLRPRAMYHVSLYVTLLRNARASSTVFILCLVCRPRASDLHTFRCVRRVQVRWIKREITKKIVTMNDFSISAIRKSSRMQLRLTRWVVLHTYTRLRSAYCVTRVCWTRVCMSVCAALCTMFQFTRIDQDMCTCHLASRASEFPAL